MKNLLNQMIEEIVGPIVFLDESFSKEIIFNKDLSDTRFYKCKFINIVFDTVVFRKAEFSWCRFQNCQILRADLTRVEFDSTSFTSCEFRQVDLSGGLFINTQFSEIKFEKILLIGLILSDLEMKTTTFHDLEFSKTYPVRIQKLKKVREVSDSNNFQEILADFYFE